MHGCVVVSGKVTSSPSAMIPLAFTDNLMICRKKAQILWHTWEKIMGGVLKSVQVKFMSQLWLHLFSSGIYDGITAVLLQNFNKL